MTLLIKQTILNALAVSVLLAVTASIYLILTCLPIAGCLLNKKGPTYRSNKATKTILQL